MSKAHVWSSHSLQGQWVFGPGTPSAASLKLLPAFYTGSGVGLGLFLHLLLLLRWSICHHLCIFGTKLPVCELEFGVFLSIKTHRM